MEIKSEMGDIIVGILEIVLGLFLSLPIVFAVITGLGAPGGIGIIMLIIGPVLIVAGVRNIMKWTKNDQPSKESFTKSSAKKSDGFDLINSIKDDDLGEIRFYRDNMSEKYLIKRGDGLIKIIMPKDTTYEQAHEIYLERRKKWIVKESGR